MLLEASDISFAYGEKPVLRNLSLEAGSGDLIVISGPSGSGKSTLLRLFNRLHDPQSGSIEFDGVPLAGYRVVDLRRRIFYLQQTPVMVEQTVMDNLLLSFTFRSSAAAAVPGEKELLRLLQRFELQDVSLGDPARNLSVGQKQRVAFIRAMLVDPQVMLLDEPISALDPLSRAVVEENIRHLAGEGVAIIAVMHSEFLSAGTRVRMRRYHLSGGHLEAVFPG